MYLKTITNLISLNDIILMFKEDKTILKDGFKFIDHLLNCRIDGNWITSRNSFNDNVKIEYNQNFVLSIDNNDIFITNFDLMDNSDKFYKFQDNHTFKNLKNAIKKFIKLSLKSGKCI